MKKFIFPISPQTHVRTTQNDKTLFYTARRIGMEAMSKEGRERILRIQKYNDYKVNLLAHAREKKFILPLQGAAIYFFIPIPSGWSIKKRKQYHMAEHQQKPDLSNLLKAFEDGLMAEDQTICHYAGLGKYWVDTFDRWDGKNKITGPGWTEVHLDLPIWNPFKGAFDNLVANQTMPPKKEVINEPPSHSLPFPDFIESVSPKDPNYITMADLWHKREDEAQREELIKQQFPRIKGDAIDVNDKAALQQILDLNKRRNGNKK